ncbi:hypothetical protein ACFYO5_35020 [Streptomyces sp. NPDC006259]|uniref:hypothetical protein n=1 Tax=Streptomyces sp. NPDC006259 TaxID=3364740 RepID=UPI0036A31508
MNTWRAAAQTGGVVWHPAGTVAEQLTWRLMTAPGVLGRASFTHTPSAGTEEIPVGSELHGLTWQPRRMLLLPEIDGTVRQVLLIQGWFRPGTHAVPEQSVTTRDGPDHRLLHVHQYRVTPPTTHAESAP